MTCIEIVKVPDADLPLAVRKAWVGLRLPYGRTKTTALGYQFGVDADIALAILEYYNPAMAAILRESRKVCPFDTIFFEESACSLSDETPSPCRENAPPRFTMTR